MNTFKLFTSRLTLLNFENVAIRRMSRVSYADKKGNVEKDRFEDLDKYDLPKIEKHNLKIPDKTTNNTLYDGVPFDKLAIVNIKATPNNTLLSLTTYD
ncbi:hypothetical protein A3Q56_06142, partial [Intoshia linei]